MVPCKCVAAWVATPVVTGNKMLFGQLLVAGKQSDCVQLCDMRRFWMANERVVLAEFPNMSLATTDRLTEPVLNVVVEAQYVVHAGVVVDVLLCRPALVVVAVATLTSGCMNRVPSLTRSTW